ncbi:MAG: hypothetical protein JXR94_18545 [Candidatus Hydrogenedentes bacterium]|nr:hypothetical protein [Candidatus Hydrogenedentota bacterium]
MRTSNRIEVNAVFPVAFVGFLLSAVLGGEAAGADDVRAAVEQFRAGYTVWDGTALSDAADALGAACRKSPDDPVCHYWLAVTCFHLLLYRMEKAEDAGDGEDYGGMTGRARAALERVLRLEPADSETHAMLGIVAGIEIRRAPVKALWLGPAVVRHRAKANRYGPRNPRTQYLIGVGHLRGEDGREGASTALPILLKAEALFARESEGKRDALAPAWGHDHCLAFIGQAYQRMGYREEAEAYCRKALAVNPACGLARRFLEQLDEAGGAHE